MSSYLCLSVRFLDALQSLHGRGDAGEAEWPPSPLRVFQALIASASDRWRKEQFNEFALPALVWLECQALFAIQTPRHQVGIPVRTAVPNNDLDVVAAGWAKGQRPKKQPNELKTMKTVRPTWMGFNNNDGNAIHYLWPLPDGKCPHLETLIAAARSLTPPG